MTDTLLIVKTQDSGSELSNTLASKGYDTLLAPVLKIKGLWANPAYIASCLRQSEFIICLSKNAVRQLHFYQGHLGHSASVWAVGHKTAAKLTPYLGKVQSPEVETSEGLWRALQPQVSAGDKVTIIKGVGGRDYLSAMFSSAGAKVKYLNLYQRTENVIAAQEFAQSMDDCAVNTAIIGSEDLFKAAYKNWPQRLLQMTLIVPSKRVALTAMRQGCKNTIIANGATPEAYLEVLQNRKGA